MAAYKLNKLHIHLADDEGWRIEIPALPELASIGSKRCHDPEERTCLLPQLGAGPEGTGGSNGYLSTADYVAILKAATARHIEVIPSIDMPGHSRAAIKAMEARYARLARSGRRQEASRYRLIDPADRTAYRSIQNYNDNTLNVCIPATYSFVETVVDAFAAMHREAGAPLRIFHLGADETAGAWVKSPACARMIAENKGDGRQLTPRFIERVSAILAAKGIATGGWSDGMGHTRASAMPKAVQTNIWGLMHSGAVTEAHDQLNRGWDVVLSIPSYLYLDMPYAPHPEEGGYTWAARGIDNHRIFGFMPGNLPANAATTLDVTATAKGIADEPALAAGRQITGIQGQLWSETVRTDGQVDYMLFPRLLGLAERAWSPATWAPAYQPGATYSWQDARVDLPKLEAGWKDFAGRVAAQFPLLDRAGIAYRVAPPGARIINGMLHANTEFPGTRTEYRTAQGSWTSYVRPVAVSGPVEIRSRSADGRRASRSVRAGMAGE
jgi:hexosaminidase